MTDAPSHFPTQKDGLLHFALVPDLSAEQVTLTLTVLSGSQSDDWYEAAVLELTEYEEKLLKLYLQHSYLQHSRGGCIGFINGGWCPICAEKFHTTKNGVHGYGMFGNDLRPIADRIAKDPLWQDTVDDEESGFDPLEYEALSVLRNPLQP